MAFLVRPPITVTLKRPGTLFALVRPNIGVNFLVRRKSTWPRKRLLAYITRIKLFFLPRIFSSLPMEAMEIDFVLFHGLCIAKPLTAVRALAWFLSSVDSLVVSSIVKRYKCLITVLADVRFFPCVNKLVFRKVVSLTKCLATLVAFVRSSVVVNVHMLVVLWRCGESFSAFCTLAIVLCLLLLDACEISKQNQATIIRFSTCFPTLGLKQLKYLQFLLLKNNFLKSVNSWRLHLKGVCFARIPRIFRVLSPNCD